MQTKKFLKTQLEFNTNIEGIISVLKMSTAIQLRQTQAKEWTKKRMLDELQESFGLLDYKELRSNKLVQQKDDHPKGIIVMTSDEGFLGDLNSLILNAGLKEKKHADDTLIVLGEKGGQYLRDSKESFLYFPGAREKTTKELVGSLKSFILQRFNRGLFKKIIIVYADFVSISARQVKVQPILPFPLETILGKISPRIQKYVTIEPSQDNVVEGLVGLSMDYVLTRILYSSKLSEYAARLTHLEMSNEQIRRNHKKLSLEYIKLIHTFADKQIREMVTARIMTKKPKQEKDEDGEDW